MDEIRDDVLLPWLEDVTDLPVVMADHSDPRPKGPHVSFKLLSNLSKIGALDERVPVYNDANEHTGTFKIRAHREFIVSIEAVGSPVGPSDDLEDFVRATDILNAVHLSLDLTKTRNIFSEGNVAIYDEGSVTDISQILETETEPRALLELGCRARFDLTDNPGYFDKAQIEGDFDTDCDGSDDYSTGIVDIPKL